MKKPLYKTIRSGIFAAIICVSSFLVIPVGTVPVSATLMCIMLCAIATSPFESVSATLVYVIMGAVGLPVFSGGSGGFGVLFGVTGGYIWSYPLLSLAVSLFANIKVKRNYLKYLFSFCGCLIGMIICYICGTIQYILVTNADFYTALTVCVIPFIPIDIIKSFIAVSIGLTVKRRI